MTWAQPFLDLLVVGHGIDPAFDDRKAGLAVSVRDSRSAFALPLSARHAHGKSCGGLDVIGVA